MTALAAEHAFDLRVDLEPVQLIPTRRGLRATFVARGGTVSGPRLRGEVLPGGGDWLVLDEDGAGRVDVRATLRLDDGTLVHMENAGVLALDDAQRARWAAGERIGGDEAYLRSCPRFEVGAGEHAWLNRSVFVAHHALGGGGVDYRVFRVA